MKLINKFDEFLNFLNEAKKAYAGFYYLDDEKYSFGKHQFANRIIDHIEESIERKYLNVTIKTSKEVTFYNSKEFEVYKRERNLSKIIVKNIYDKIFDSAIKKYLNLDAVKHNVEKTIISLSLNQDVLSLDFKKISKDFTDFIINEICIDSIKIINKQIEDLDVDVVKKINNFDAVLKFYRDDKIGPGLKITIGLGESLHIFIDFTKREILDV